MMIRLPRVLSFPIRGGTWQKGHGMMKRKRRFHVVVLREDGKQYHNRVVEWLQIRRGLALAGTIVGGLTLGTFAFFILAASHGHLVARNIELKHQENQLKKQFAELGKRLDEARNRLSQSEQQLASIEELAKEQNLKVKPMPGLGGPESDAPVVQAPPKGAPSDPRIRAIESGIRDLKSQADFVYHETQDVGRVLRPHLDQLAHTPSIWPVKGFISSGFGARQDPLDGEPEIHEGIDIAAPYGSPVEAPAEGLVIAAGWMNGYGNCIEISHGNGLVTRYGHLSKILVKPGQTVKRWQKIGLVGSTGHSTGPHLHYEIRRNDRPINPKRFLLY